jgi:hypothetical protein
LIDGFSKRPFVAKCKSNQASFLTLNKEHIGIKSGDKCKPEKKKIEHNLKIAKMKNVLQIHILALGSTCNKSFLIF